MSLTSLKQALLKTAADEESEIISEANKEKRRIINSAKKQAEQILLEAKEQTKKLIASEKSEKHSAMKLHTKRILSEAREEAVEKATELVWEQLKYDYQGKKQDKLLDSLIRQGLNELGNKGIVYLNSKDFSSAAAKNYAQYLSKEAIDYEGGAIITSQDGKITINNSIESLLETHKDEIKKKIYLSLFHEKKK